MANSSGLASLSATYTDSEGEEDHHVDGYKAGTVILTEESSLSKPPSPAVVVTTKKRRNVKRLVSYHDDTYVSTEEEHSEYEETETMEIDVKEEEVFQIEEEKIENIESPLKFINMSKYEGISLPEEPKGKCCPELQEKVNVNFEKMIKRGIDMNESIQKNKNFRNPSIYEKLIQYCNINEFGTNYPLDLYNPSRWGEESFYEELAKAQKADMERREKEKRDKAKVEIMTGTAKRTPSTITDEPTKRKSKWDQIGTSSTAVTQQVTTLTASVTGTKTTVLSAFGSLPKRPRF